MFKKIAIVVAAVASFSSAAVFANTEEAKAKCEAALAAAEKDGHADQAAAIKAAIEAGKFEDCEKAAPTA